jgi:membrane protein
VASPKALIGRVQASLPMRAWQRYGKARGGVLAGGMAYAAFFSLFPALAVGFTVFGLVVGDDPELQGRVIKAVNDGIGTTIITPIGAKGGIVSIDQLTGSNQLTIAAIIGLVGFLFTGLGWLDAMREGVRAMFGRPTLEGNVVTTKLRDLAVLASIGVVLLSSAIGGVAVSSATGALLGWVGLDESVLGRLLLGAASTLVLLAVDVMVFLLIFRLLAGVHLPRHDLWDAALFGGVGLGILKLFAGVLLGSAGDNTFLAAAGVLLGLLIWLNLVSRLTLVAAAWGATVAIDRGHLAELEGGPMLTLETEAGRRAAAEPQRDRVAGAGSPRPAAPTPTAARLPGPRPGAAAAVPVSAVRAGEPALAGAAAAARPGGPAAAVPFTPVVSPRQADRISVAAGAVLGAAGLVAGRVAAGAVRSVIDSVRRPDPD